MSGSPEGAGEEKKGMKGLVGLLLLLVVGCSTHPLADALDFAFPPRMPAPGTPTFGGVGVPQPAPPPEALLQPPPPPPLPAERPVPAIGPS